MGNVHRNTHCFNLEQKCSMTYLGKKCYGGMHGVFFRRRYVDHYSRTNP